MNDERPARHVDRVVLHELHRALHGDAQRTPRSRDDNLPRGRQPLDHQTVVLGNPELALQCALEAPANSTVSPDAEPGQATGKRHTAKKALVRASRVLVFEAERDGAR